MDEIKSIIGLSDDLLLLIQLFLGRKTAAGTSCSFRTIRVSGKEIQCLWIYFNMMLEIITKESTSNVINDN